MKRLLLAVMLIAMAPGAAAPALAELKIPDKREHPYLYFDAEDLAKLRQRYRQGPLRAYRTALIREADRFLDQNPEEVGPRDHDISPNAVQSLLWAYHLTGEDKYRQAAIAYIQVRWDKTKFGQWSEMGTGAVATAYDTLYHELTDEQRAKMKAYLERALDQHLRNANGWLYNNPSNTVPAQCGAAGMAALALLWESPKAPRALEMTVSKLKTYAAQCFSPDGGYTEGTLYWGFGGSFYLAFAHAHYNTTGDKSLIEHPRLKDQYRFAETILGGDGQQMPFNDTQPRFYALPVCTDLGVRYGNDLLLWLADHMMAIKAGGPNPHDIGVGARGVFLAFSVIFRGQQRGPEAFPGVPTLSYLDRMEWGVMRSRGEAFIPELVVGVKGSGGPLSHHKQNDLGSFMLYAGGEMLLIDPGYFQGGAREHTLPLVDGKGPGHSGSQIAEAWEDGPWRVMVVDSTAAYKLADRVRRTLVMRGDQAVVVLDDVLPGSGVEAEGTAWSGWTPEPAVIPEQKRLATAQYQAAHEPVIDAGGRRATIPGHQTALHLWTFGPEIELDARERDFGRSWRFRQQARAGKFDWHSLEGTYVLHVENPLVTVLMPAPRGEQAPASPQYKRTENSITVTLAGGHVVEFALVHGRWTLKRPTRPP